MRALWKLAILFIVVCTISSAKVYAQDTPKEYKDYSYAVLEDQFRQMMQSRGGSGIQHYTKVLKEYENHGFSSDQGFADLLARLYPNSLKTGFILYLHHNDSLRRVFMSPGKVLEQKTIPITSAALSDLHKKIIQNLGIAGQIRDRAPQLRGVTVPRNKDKSSKKLLEHTIQEATKLLLPDTLDERFEHLVIIPALNIGTFPFHVLKPYNDNSYLIDKCSFVMAPSLVDLVALRLKLINKHDVNSSYTEDSVTFPFKNPLFVSNPAYPTHTKYHFPDLPGAKDEIANTLAYASSYTLLEGHEVKKDQVINNLQRSDIAYFATHGIASETMPLDSSFLVLSGEQDPFLTAREIMELHKSDNGSFPVMVILSACQTGLGKTMESGITGLSRSFLIAGSYFVMMSLWNVDDEATAYLMNRFSYYLQRPNLYLPAEPLRLAILDTKKKYPNPTQWASFSTFGVTF